MTVLVAVLLSMCIVRSVLVDSMDKLLILISSIKYHLGLVQRESSNRNLSFVI